MIAPPEVPSSMALILLGRLIWMKWAMLVYWLHTEWGVWSRRWSSGEQLRNHQAQDFVVAENPTFWETDQMSSAFHNRHSTPT